MTLYLLDLAGTFAFAVSGTLLGVKKDMDVYGCFVLALVTGAGGGTMRDLMLGAEPFILKDVAYIISISLAVLAVWQFKRFVERVNKPLITADAVGLGVFTVIGATKGIDAGLAPHAVILLAILTGTGGGMIRDIIANEVPVVLTKEVYASASLIGAAIFLLLSYTDMSNAVNAVISATIVTFIRLYTLKINFHLPKYKGLQ